MPGFSNQSSNVGQYNPGPTPDMDNWWEQTQQGQYYNNLANQYQDMSSIPTIGTGGQQYQWAMDPATGQLRPVEYNPYQQQQNSWQAEGTMPGGGPQYQDWDGMTDMPGYQMPGSYGGQDGQQWSNVNPYQTGAYQAGDQWGQGQYGMGSGVMQQGMQGYAPESSLDPQRVIDASVAPLEYQRDVGFADASARAGQSGFAMSTPYMEALGGVEQRSLQDLDKITQEYLYNAAVQKGNWDMQAQQGALDRSLSSYGTHSGYGHAGQMRDLNAADAAQAQAQQLNAQGQLQDMGNQYNAWAQSGNWQMDQNRAAQDAWRIDNQYNQDAWRLGNQYANTDYWAGVNQWGDPGMIDQVMSGMNNSPWGDPYRYPDQNQGNGFTSQTGYSGSDWWNPAQQAPQGQGVL